MNKEECLQALDDIIGKTGVMNNCCGYVGRCIKDGRCKFDSTTDDCADYENFNTLKELITEHFDNPPLKFEDLKEGMWVWDDKEKWYMKIVFLFAPCKQYHFKGSFKVWADSCERSLDFVVFEENRFYRRQKEDK